MSGNFIFCSIFEKHQKPYGFCMSGNAIFRSIFEKQQKHSGFSLFKGGPKEPVLAREREARSNVRSLSQARCLRRCNNVKMPCWNESKHIKNPSQGTKLHAQNLSYKKHTKIQNGAQQVMKIFQKHEPLVLCISKHLTCTSCGLRPRLRRCLDHVQHIEKSNCNATLQPC